MNLSELYRDEKDLGVIISSHLQFGQQYKKAVNKAVSVLQFIKTLQILGR